MTKDTSYIRMNEATKEFGKTRQTFYNYINRGEISTKKIHNKTYLSVRDIKRVLGHYIGEIPTQHGTKEPTYTRHEAEVSTHTSNFDTPQTQHFSNQIERLEKKINNIPNDFSLYTQQVNTENRHYVETTVSRVQGYVKNMQEYIEATHKRFSLQRKKLQFTVFYMSLILVNVVIVLFLA